MKIKRMATIEIMLVIMITTLSSCGLFVKYPECIISGNITDMDSNPVEGVAIFIENSWDLLGDDFTAATDSGGNYSITMKYDTRLSASTSCTLELSKDGYESLDYTSLYITENDLEIENIDFSLYCIDHNQNVSNDSQWGINWEHWVAQSFIPSVDKLRKVKVAVNFDLHNYEEGRYITFEIRTDDNGTPSETILASGIAEGDSILMLKQPESSSYWLYTKSLSLYPALDVTPTTKYWIVVYSDYTIGGGGQSTEGEYKYSEDQGQSWVAVPGDICFVTYY